MELMLDVYFIILYYYSNNFIVKKHIYILSVVILKPPPPAYLGDISGGYTRVHIHSLVNHSPVLNQGIHIKSLLCQTGQGMSGGMVGESHDGIRLLSHLCCNKYYSIEKSIPKEQQVGNITNILIEY
jgi:hypothetical protein